jgi:hypothetical protein
LAGGALYSAVGAQIWNRSVGIHSVTGRPYIDYVRSGIEEHGLDTTGSPRSMATAAALDPA